MGLSRGPGWDSNPGSADLESAVLNHSTNGPREWREEDLNLRPSVYETDELPDCYYPAMISGRFELTILGVRDPWPKPLVEETKILYNK